MNALFFGMTDREIAEAIAEEMRYRNLLGCLYMFPETGGAGVFASSSPAGLLTNLSAAQQLAVFAECAAEALSETREMLSDELSLASKRDRRPN